jgi:prevent-host-death family protein
MYGSSMTTPASQEWNVPEEISVTDARPIIGELVEAAASGKVIHLTKRGRRVAKLVPETSEADVNAEFMAAVDRVIEQYKDVFDRLAEL